MIVFHLEAFLRRNIIDKNSSVIACGADSNTICVYGIHYTRSNRGTVTHSTDSFCSLLLLGYRRSDVAATNDEQ